MYLYGDQLVETRNLCLKSVITVEMFIKKYCQVFHVFLFVRRQHCACKMGLMYNWLFWVQSGLLLNSLWVAKGDNILIQGSQLISSDLDMHRVINLLSIHSWSGVLCECGKLKP